MISIFKHILTKREDPSLVGDVTTEDWDPPPPGGIVPGSLADWLQEEPSRLPPAPPRVLPSRGSSAPNYMEYLSTEEQRVVQQQQQALHLKEAEAQRAERREQATSLQAQILKEVEHQWDRYEPKLTVCDFAAGPPVVVPDEVTARIKEPPGWIAVLKAYGEHLSYRELLVIRQQLSRGAT